MMKSTKILAEVEDIKKLLDPTVIEKARRYDELSEHLRHFKMSVQKVSSSMDDNGRAQVIVIYEPIKETIKVYDDGKTESSDRFKAINFLNMSNLSDMRKISVAIDETKSKLKD